MTRRCLILKLVLLLHIFCVGTSFTSAWAQTQRVNYKNLNFSLSSATQISPSEYQLSFDFGEIIVPAENWQAHALEVCFTNNCENFSLPELLDYLALDGQAEQSLKQAALSYLKKNYQEEPLYQELKKRSLSSAAEGGENAGTSAGMQLCQGLLVELSACKQIKTFENRILLSKELIAGGNTQGFLMLLATFANSKELLQSSELIIAELSRLASTARFEDFIELLSLLPEELVTERVLQLLEAKLSEQVQPVKAATAIGSLTQARKDLLMNNPQLQEQLGDFLKQQVEGFSAVQDFESLGNYLNVWTGFVEDYPTLASSNKVDLYIWLITLGKVELAKNFMSSLEAEFTWSDKIRIFYTHYFRSLNYWIVISLAILVISLLLWFVILYLKNIAITRKAARILRAEDQDPQPQKIFSVGSLAVSPKMIRYRECLKRIGLEGPVNIKEIKAAYRRAVKSAHPDVNPELAGSATEGEAANNFMNITQAYDDALALHREMVSDQERI